MIGSSSAITSSTSSGTRKLVTFSGMRPASMPRDVEDVVDERQQVARVRVDARQALALRRRSPPRDAMQQHVRVAEDRVERRPELVRDVGEELRLEGRRLLELDVLPPQQLVLLRQLRGRLLHLALEFGRRLLQLLVEPRLVDRLGQVVQDRDDPDELALLGEDRARPALRPAARGRSPRR